MNFKELADKIGLDEEDYRELVELFLDTGKADYDQLKSAFAASDDEQVARSAHTISGASGNLGLMNIHELAKRIELAAIDKKLDGVGGDVETLQGLFDKIAQSVNG
jgi:HPt (histidine-containing phosphotransfer) domain-containing protein